MFRREEYVVFSWTFSFLCSARCSFACRLCRSRSVKSSLSGGMRNGFLLPSSALGCRVAVAAAVAGMGGRGVCFVRLEREPGVPTAAFRDTVTPTVDKDGERRMRAADTENTPLISPDFFKGIAEGD